MNNQSYLQVLDTFIGKRILITGGNGFLATNLINLLKDVTCEVVRLDLPGITPARVEGVIKIKNVISDIRVSLNWESVLEDVDIVFHFAAQTSAYLANEDPSADLDINVRPILHLLETCRLNNLQPVVIFASTATISGIPTHLPVDERHIDNPITIYDLHKLMAEQYLKYYINQKVITGSILRLANIYGPGPKSSSLDRGVLNLMINNALNGKPLNIYGRGDYLRDYIYVEDVARAFLYAAAKIKKINGQHFIIGSGKGYTLSKAINLVADRVAQKTGGRIPVNHVKPESSLSPIETRNFMAKPRRFMRLTSWQAHYSLSDGIDRTIEEHCK